MVDDGVVTVGEPTRYIYESGVTYRPRSGRKSSTGIKAKYYTGASSGMVSNRKDIKQCATTNEAVVVSPEPSLGSPDITKIYLIEENNP